MFKKLGNITLVLVLIVTIPSLWLLWFEGKNEVFYLCGNFAPGDSRAGVVRQLDTANLLVYETVSLDSGSRIEASALWGYLNLRCLIELDAEEIVQKVRYE